MTANHHTLLLKGDCLVKLDRIPDCPKCGEPESQDGLHAESGEAALTKGATRQVASVTFFCRTCASVVGSLYTVKDHPQPGALVTRISGPPVHYFQPQR